MLKKQERKSMKIIGLKFGPNKLDAKKRGIAVKKVQTIIIALLSILAAI